MRQHPVRTTASMRLCALRHGQPRIVWETKRGVVEECPEPIISVSCLLKGHHFSMHKAGEAGIDDVRWLARESLELKE